VLPKHDVFSTINIAGEKEPSCICRNLESECCDSTTIQTNRLSHQQRQDATVNISNTQLYTFITTFGKTQIHSKMEKITTGV
jgi:hypothetical protein